ncbi:hypothetical protein BJ741DRAFT_715278 [Chytriomyces cf. hyalinus JEL632]|nr:hypothetical protein BJ741DRAFT_715278 [Chytriomyces cf. hyalinus JEL632]
MPADMTGADMAAFYISAIMLVVMIITLLLFLAVVFKSTNQPMSSQSSTIGQSSTRKKTRHAFPPIFTVFNVSLLGMILGSAALFSSLLLSLPLAHTYWHVRGAILLESVGGNMFESCYCIYSWSRSKSLVGESGSVLYWILTALAVVNLIMFSAQLISAVLFEYNLASIQFFQDVVASTITGMFLMDVGMLWCFCHYLFENPAPASSTGQFNGNIEAQKQWNRTSIIAKYGAFSCISSFLTLAIIVGGRLIPSLVSSLNLMNACGYSAAASGAIILLVMKIKLESGCGKLFESTTKVEKYCKTGDEES